MRLDPRSESRFAEKDGQSAKTGGGGRKQLVGQRVRKGEPGGAVISRLNTADLNCNELWARRPEHFVADTLTFWLTPALSFSATPGLCSTRSFLYYFHMPYFLGVVCYGWHESAAVLIRDGKVIAAAEEERFTRKKFDSNFPDNAIEFCLKRANIQINDIAAIGYGFDPRRKPFHKALHLVRHFPKSLNLLTSRGDLLKKMNSIEQDFRRIGFTGKIIRLNHHLCHAASTFLVSPFENSAILTIDGAGDWEASWWGVGSEHKITELGRMYWPLSLGHVYAAFTEYLGFQPFSDEYRVMGLAPYGKATMVREMEKIFWPTSDGYAINFDYFNYPTGHFPRFGRKIEEVFGPSLKNSENQFSEHYRNVAASLQAQLEVVILHLARLATERAGSKKLCLAGGVAMNCVANGRLIAEKIVDDIYVPPCASDCGVALGAAYLAQQIVGGDNTRSLLGTALLGPDYTEAEIQKALCEKRVQFEKVYNPSQTAAELLADGKVIGWFQGRMEFGQRALGARSILADPRKAEMKEIINAKVKFREFFRPFAPSVLQERASEFFVYPKPIPFMTEVCPVREEKKTIIPAVTHCDGTARVQTVSAESNAPYYELIQHFGKLTGVPVVLNTSFNVKGQPIVNTPLEAIETFQKTDIDALVCGAFLVTK